MEQYKMDQKRLIKAVSFDWGGKDPERNVEKLE